MSWPRLDVTPEQAVSMLEIEDRWMRAFDGILVAVELVGGERQFRAKARRADGAEIECFGETPADARAQLTATMSCELTEAWL